MRGRLLCLYGGGGVRGNGRHGGGEARVWTLLLHSKSVGSLRVKVGCIFVFLGFATE